MNFIENSYIQIIIFFVLFYAGLLVYFFRLKKKNDLKALQISANELWPQVSKRLQASLLKESDLLFGTWTFPNYTTTELLIKNSENKLVARAEFVLSDLGFNLYIDQSKYRVDYLAKWRRSAQLTLESENTVLSAYSQLFGLRRNKFTIPVFGEIFAERVGWSQKFITNYRYKGQLIASTQEISSTFKVGRLGVFCQDLPLEIKLFILVLG